jgi:hypothetical protein
MKTRTATQSTFILENLRQAVLQLMVYGAQIRDHRANDKTHLMTEAEFDGWLQREVYLIDQHEGFRKVADELWTKAFRAGLGDLASEITQEAGY